MKTIIYIHGFRSSSESSTYLYLKKMIPEFNILSFDIPVEPNKALSYIKDMCNIYNTDLVIGNSLGGFYTAQLSSKYLKILLNPALRQLEANLGTDGSEIGKEKLFQILKDYNKILDRNTWSEVSGKMEHILPNKIGYVPLPNTFTEYLLPDKECILSEDGYHYTRFTS